MRFRAEDLRPHGWRPVQVYQRLRDLIVQGVLGPGSRVVETEVAGRLGVCRAPVREALLRLELVGVVGGGPGALGRNWVERGDGSVEEFGATHTAEMQAGDVFAIETPGGGGFGS